MHHLITETFDRTGTRVSTGMELLPAFHEAGLLDVHIRVVGAFLHYAGGPVAEQLAALARSMLPRLRSTVSRRQLSWTSTRSPVGSPTKRDA